jgi:hypothetical protein
MHKRWNGTSAWVVVADARIAQTVSDISALTSQVSAVSAQADRSITTFYGTSTPATPESGDLWLTGVAGEPMKRYNGSAWLAFEDPNVQAAYAKAGDAQSAADAKVRTFAQTDEPTGMVPNDVGDLWIDTNDNNKLWRYSGAAWVAVQDAGIAAAQGTANTALSTASTAVTAANAAQTTADGKNTSYYQNDQPTGGTYKIGDLWFDTNDNYKMRTFAGGTTWQLTQDSAGAQAAAISAAATDATTKATNAQTAAINAAALDAEAKAATAEANAISAAASDAATKAATAKAEAIAAADTAAQLKADGAEEAAIAAAALDAEAKADAAEQAAITAAALDATNKAATAKAEALSGAATDAQTRATEAKTQAIEAAASDATAKADAAQTAAIQAQAYSLNPSFEEWTGTYPVYYSAFNAAPTKETTTVRTGKYAVRFNSPDATTQRGITTSSFMAHAPNLEYFTLELDVRLDSGTSFGGSGVLLDWTGMTGGNRVTVSLASEIPAPVTGRWYRVTKVLRRPATATGTLTGYNMWLMGQYNVGLGTMAIKNVIFDWINIRPSTTEEITAYGTPASISSINSSVSSLSDTVNTKTKSWFQTGQPPLTGNTAGDLWFDTDDNNKIYIWNATNSTWAVASDQRIEALNTSVSAVQTSANGKNKVIWSTSDATGTAGYVAGDTWFKRDGSGNVIAQWEFTTSWQSRAIAHQVIASLDASKAVIGTLSADRIATNSLAANKLFVGDLTNLAADGNFVDTTKMNWTGSGTVMVSAGEPNRLRVITAASGNNDHANQNLIQVTPGEKIFGEVYVYGEPTNVGAGGPNMHMVVSDNNGTPTWPTFQTLSRSFVSGKWERLSGIVTMPAGAKQARVELAVSYSADAVGNTYYFRNVSVRRMATGELIVDGAIKANSAIIAEGAIGNAHIGVAAVDSAEIKDLAVTNAKIEDLAITNAKIQNATIDSAKIASVSAETITVGKLQGWQIEANAIDASKLNVSIGGSNLVSNSSFEVDSDSNGVADSWQVWVRGSGDAGRVFTNTRPAGLFPGSTFAQRVTSTTVTNAESSSIQNTTLFSIGPSVSAVISLYGRASVAGTYSISIRCEDDGGVYKGDAFFNAAFSTTAQRFMGTVITPAGTTRGKITITTPVSISSGHWFEVDGVQAELGNVGSSWGPKTDELLPGTIKAGMLAADAVTATNISVTALDGKTITGATIQTDNTPVSAARGIKLTSTELGGWDAAGVKNFSLTSAGVLSLRGSLESGSSIKGATLTGTGIETTATANRGVKINNNGVSAYDGGGNLTFKVDGNNGIVEAPGMKANSITGDKIASKTIDVGKLTVQDFSNYVENPSFETGDLTGWDITGGWMVNNAAPHTGTYKALVAYNGTTQAITNKAEVTLPAGGKVRVKFRIYSETPSVSGSQAVIALYNVVGGALESVTPIVQAGQWIEVDRELTAATAGAKRLQIATTGAGTGYLRVDSIVMNRMMNGELIVDGAIDGKTITGALIQTDSTPVSAARGIKLTSSELAGYDAAGVKNFSLTSAGVLAVRGDIQSGSNIIGATITGSAGIQTSSATNRGVKINNNGVSAYDAGGSLTFKVDGNNGIVEAPGILANSIKGDKLTAGTVSADRLLISDFTNLLDDPSIFGPGWIKGGGTAQSSIVADATEKINAWRFNAAGWQVDVTNTNVIPVVSTDRFVLSLRAYSTLNASGYLRVLWFNESMGSVGLQDLTIPANASAWASYSIANLTPPGTAKFMKIQPIIGATATTGYILYGSMTLRRRFGGELIVDGAINGQTITGATIQTDTTPVSGASARGIKLTAAELAGYDTSGVKNFSLATDGTLVMRGQIKSGSSIEGVTITGTEGVQTSASVNRGVKINNNGVSAYDAGGSLTFKVDGSTGVVEAPGMKANSITGDKIAGSTITAKNLFVGDFANLATIDEVNGITVSSYGPTQIVGGYNKLITDSGNYFMFTDQRGPVPFELGETLYFEFIAKATVATTAQFNVWTYSPGVTATTLGPTFNIGTTDTTIKLDVKIDQMAVNASTFVLGLGSGVANKGIQVKKVHVYRKFAGNLIVDGAIDGKTITGATIQTDSTPVSAPRGIKLTATELAGYDAAGVKNFSLTSTGALSVRGDIESGSKIKGVTLEGSGIETSNVVDRGVKIKSTGVTAYDGSGNMTFKVDAGTGEVQAPGIKANSIKGDKIEASSITVDKMLIASGNIHTDPSMKDASGWSLDAGVTLSASGGRTAGGSLNITQGSTQVGGYYASTVPAKRFAVKSKGFYRASVWVKGSANIPVGGVSLFFRTYAADDVMTWATPLSVSNTAIITAGVWTELSGTFEMPVSAVQGAIGLYKNTSYTTGTTTFSDAFVQQASSGELIVDGAIKTSHMQSDTIDGGVITAGTLKATKLEAKSIGVDRLTISSSDNLIVEAAFEHPLTPGSSWTRDATKIIQPTGGRFGTPALRLTGVAFSANTSYNLNNKVVVDQDSRFRVSMWVKTNVVYSNGAIRLGVKPYSGATAGSAVILFSNSSNAASANYVAGNDTYTLIEGVTDPLPANTTSVEFYVSASAPSATAYVDIDSVSVTRASTGKLIVDGSITAAKLETDLVLATRVVAGDPTGTFAEMSPMGFRVFADGVDNGPSTEVVRLGVASTNDYFAVTKANGSVAATISSEGVGSFDKVSIPAYDPTTETNNAITGLPEYGTGKGGLWYGGDEFQTHLNQGRLIARAYRNTASAFNAANGVHQPYVRLDRVFLKKGNLYRVSTGPVRMDHDAGTNGYMSIWMNTSTTNQAVAATIGTPSVAIAETVSDSGPVRTSDASLGLVAPTEDCWASFLFSFSSQGPGQVGIRSSSAAPFRMLVENLGRDVGTSGINLDGTNPPPPSVNTYQKQFGSAAIRSYDGANNFYNFDTGHMYQGLSPAGYGNMKSISIQSNMTSDLSGATINWMRVYFLFDHWYYNSGGTARVGVHGHTSLPGSFTGTGSASFSASGIPKPGDRWIDIPSNLWDGFKTGTYRGVFLEGDGQYGTYGYARPPVIEVNYTK